MQAFVIEQGGVNVSLNEQRGPMGWALEPDHVSPFP